MFKSKWNIENIRTGCERFFKEFSRYPTAEDFDNYPYLPSARQIQRAFGGLVELRDKLGLEIVNYGSGDHRSKSARDIGVNGAVAERLLEQELIDHFGEHFVHAERPLYKYYKVPLRVATQDTKEIGKSRVDFLVYHSDGIFGVDVFVAKNMFSLKRIVNLKAGIYTGLNIDIFFVNGGLPHLAKNNEIEDYCRNKSKQLDPNIRVMNQSDFILYIKKLKPLSIVK